MKFNTLNQTFTVELDNMDRMLMQIELTVMAGDHESYKISAYIENEWFSFVSFHTFSKLMLEEGDQ